MIVVKDMRSLLDLVDECYNTEAIYLDLESTGLSPYNTSILLASLHVNGKTYVIDFLSLPVRECFAALRAPLESVKVRKVLHNAVFDWQHIFHHTGVFMRNVYCTLIGEQVVKAGLLRMSDGYGLDDVAFRRLGILMDKSVRNGFIDRDTSLPMTETEYKYAGDDAWVLEKIYLQQIAEAEKYELIPTLELEVSIIPVTARMEYYGINIDKTRLESAIPVIDSIIEKSGMTLQDLAIANGFADEILITGKGYSAFNPNSNVQMLSFIRHFGVDVESMKASELADWDSKWASKRSSRTIQEFDADSFEDADIKMGYEHPILQRVSALKASEKIKGTYILGLLDKIHPVTKKIHPRFRQCGAVATGRFSSDSPNFQNLPNQSRLQALGMKDHDIRSMFIASPGRTLIISDYSGIELSILAAMSKDEQLTYQILQGDIHNFVANSLFGDEIEKALGERLTLANKDDGLFKAVRTVFKGVSFAICYGSTGWTIYKASNQKLLSAGLHISQELCDTWVTRWKSELFPGTGDLFAENGLSAVTNFYTKSINGRRRFWDEREVRSEKKRYFAAMREGMNQPIQSTSADITKRAMYLVGEELNWNRARIVACIHDELLLESDMDYLEEASAITKRGMEKAGRDFLPWANPDLISAKPKPSLKYDK